MARIDEAGKRKLYLTVCKQPMVSSREVFKNYEDAFEDDSFIARSALPHAQALTAEFLGLGKRAGLSWEGTLAILRTRRCLSYRAGIS